VPNRDTGVKSSPGRGWLMDIRTANVANTPAETFRLIERIGGATGYYYADWLWQLRGRFDSLIGGVGMRRGRRDPECLTEGDAVDFWRVEAIEPCRLLRLRAEMKVPGDAWLQFVVDENELGCSVRQEALFKPSGSLGYLYRYALYPAHDLIFRGMLRAIARRAEGN